MANLNIPFLLQQENQSQFDLDTQASKLIQRKSFSIDEHASDLLVLSDSNTGTLVLCSQESFLTYPKPPQPQMPNKFLVNIKPQVLCIPQIFQNTPFDRNELHKVQLLDFCLVRSPAAKVLNTSDYLLVTIHKETQDDSVLRIWSTDDGRCVMRSPKTLFQNRLPRKLHVVSEDHLPGLILCACQDNEILIINTFTMSLVDVIQGSFQGFVESKFYLNQTKIQFSILDQTSTLYVWTGMINTEFKSKDSEVSGSISSAASSTKQQIQSRSKQLRQCSSLILNGEYPTQQAASNNSIRQAPPKPKISFKLEQSIQSQSADKNNMINQGRGRHQDLICYGELSSNKFVIVYQDRLEVVDGNQTQIGQTHFETKVLLQYEKLTLKDIDPNYQRNARSQQRKDDEDTQKWFLFAQFRQTQEHYLQLICVDSEHNLLVFSVANSDELTKILEINLFKDSHLFDLESMHIDEQTQKTLLCTQQELMKDKVERIMQQKNEMQVSKYSFFSEKSLLYCYLPSKTNSTAKVLTWSLESMLKQQQRPASVPLVLSQFDIFGSSRFSKSGKDPNCILNLNQYVTKSYFTRHQHSFFYSDEKITDQTFYVASDFPSMVVGTNYGRIFIVQLFQDIERRAYPVVVIDCHNSTPITCLYIAYSSARRQRQANSAAFFDQQRERSSSQALAQSISLDSGGHLIACSEDGTVSVTNMNSAGVVKKLADFSLTRNEREIKRIDRYMRTREENRRQRRRQSVDLQFSTEHFFNLVRAEPFKLFSSLATGRLSRVLEVQVVQKSQLDRQKYQQQASEPPRAGPFGTEAPTGVATPTTALETAPTSASLSADKAREAPLKSESPRSPGLGAKATANHYQHHLQSIKDLFQNEYEAAARQSALLQEFMPFRASYACIDTDQHAVFVIQIQNASCDVLRAQGLDSKPIGVYEDALQNLVHIVTERNLNVYTYNQQSKQLLRKSGYAFGQATLQMNQTIGMLLEQQQYFKQSTSLSEAGLSYDQHSFEQQFLEHQPQAQRVQRVGSSLHAAGHHRALDFLSMSLSLPLYYHPHHILSQKYTKSIRDLLPHQQDFRACLSQPRSRDYEAKVVKDSLRTLITNDFVWNDRYKSDFSQEYYHAQGAVTPLLTGSQSDPSEAGQNPTFRQQMIIINTKDMINIFKNRMKVLTESLGRVGRGARGGSAGDGDGGEEGGGPAESETGVAGQQQAQPNISADYLQNSKWPTRLLALVHPFTLDGTLDENLELFFGLSIPYIDFRIGVQGIDESFSFIIAREDRDKEEKMGDDNACCAISSEESLKLLRLSRVHSAESSPQDDIESKMVFVNSEYWKASSYMSTVMCSFFLGTLVSIVEYAQPDITTLMQDWLNVVQYITSSSSQQDGRQGAGEAVILAGSGPQAREHLPKPLSVSALSQLMLRKDHSISSCARDVIMKPLLSSGSSIDHIKEEVNEWQDLIMDTYLKLKEDASMRQAYDADASQSNSLKPPQRQGPTETQPRASSVGRKALGGKSGAQASRPKSGGGPPSERPTQPATGAQRALAPQDGQDAGPQAPEEAKQGPRLASQAAAGADKSINHFFGELEIRGLVNLSYYALYSQDGPEQQRIETDVQNRLCKCTVILTREIMTKFTSNSKEHQNLLTILMQLLQTQMRAEVPTFKTKVIKEDVIKILLLIYDFYKKQLRDERFLTRVVAENFHLIHPKNSELYLKLTAAKTLLEIGTYFTEDFLSLIHEQATTLKDGPEYQRNVLDVLRYFINGSRDGLEPHLIQIVQTLLKCLDPNDEQLRKNSTQLISIILSTMVKSFPMIAFHHETQRLAVGTPGGPIAIYDVRTSQKWKILEGHQRSVLCVEFDQKGNLLASYSGADLSLRLWKVGNTGFFQTIMGGTGKSMKEIKLAPIPAPQRGAQLANGRGRQRSNQLEPRKNGAQQGETQVRCKIKFSEGGKSVQLTREDGTINKDLRL